MKDILILGAGGFGSEVEFLIKRINNSTNPKKWNLLGFVDDTMDIGTKIRDYEVVYHTEDLITLNKKVSVVIAIASPSAKEKIYNKLKKNKNLDFPNLIDPSVILGSVTFGIGNVICAGTIMTTDVKINNFVVINLKSTIGHNSSIDDYTTLYPNVNVSGNVNVGKSVEIGTGSQIIEKKSICDNVIIGAGAVVVKDINESGTYVGVPVKLLQK